MRFQAVMQWLELLFFPPVCRHCGQRRTVFTTPLPQPLCSDCLALWTKETERICPQCGKAYAWCCCVPERLRDAGCDTLIKRAIYTARRPTVVSRLLLRIKDVNDRKAFYFVADDLMMPVFQYLLAQHVDVGQVVLTYVPRRRSSVRWTGHDQAKQLSRILAKRLGCQYMKTVCRKSDGREQKNLTLAERADNIAHRFSLIRSTELKDRTVLLLDDVCTTGASLAACTELLYRGGARRVVAVCVARTEKAEQ